MEMSDFLMHFYVWILSKNIKEERERKKKKRRKWRKSKFLHQVHWRIWWSYNVSHSKSWQAFHWKLPDTPLFNNTPCVQEQKCAVHFRREKSDFFLDNIGRNKSIDFLIPLFHSVTFHSLTWLMQTRDAQYENIVNTFCQWEEQWKNCRIYYPKSMMKHQ